MEEAGKLADAVDKFEGICTRWPDSKYCPLANDRSAEASIRLAHEQVRALKFEQAEATLRHVRDTKGPEWSAKASALMQSPEIVMGLRWLKVSAQMEKAKTASLGDRLSAKKDLLDEVTEIADSNTPASTLAQDWLANERPSVFLLNAGTACGGGLTWDAGHTDHVHGVGMSDELIRNEAMVKDCIRWCALVLEKHKETVEAGVARRALLGAAQTVCSSTRTTLAMVGTDVRAVELPKPCSQAASKSCDTVTSALRQAAPDSDEARKASELLQLDQRRCCLGR